jgi:hypothetical protein
MPFDVESAVAARQANPRLTPYDTGEMLQPELWTSWRSDEGWGDSPVDDFGKVDFENDEGGTELTVFAHPSTIEDDVILVQIDSGLARKIKVVLNDADLGTYPTE